MNNGTTRITASQLQSLLSVLYVLIVDYRKNGVKAADTSTRAQLQTQMANAKRWSRVLPELPHAVASAISGGDKLQHLVLLGHEIKEQYQAIHKNTDFSSEELDALKSAGMYLRTDSEGAMAKLMRLASLSNNPWVTQQLRPTKLNQGSAETALMKVVRQLSGRKDNALTMEEAEVARSTYPELYKEYLALRRVFNQSWKNAMTDYIRSTGQKLVPYQDVLDHLNRSGVKYSLIKGFTGLIDDRGRLYTNQGDLIAGVPAAVNFPTVVMNKDYPKTQWVFQSRRPDGGPGQNFYTEKFRQAQSKKKFSNVEKLSEKMPSIRRKWFVAVKNFDKEDPRCVASLILELLYMFSARVGTPGNTTYGIGTLLVKHIIPQANGNLLIRYKGKDGILHKHILLNSDPEMKASINAIIELIDGKDITDKVFSIGRRPVGPNMANALFKQLSGMPDITVHKIRTFRGTALFKELMSTTMPKLQKKRNLTERQAMEVFKAMAEKVGKMLNHIRRGNSGNKVTGATAIGSYIDHAASASFFEALGFRPPRVLEKSSD